MQPDWRPLVATYLKPWATTGLAVADVDEAEAWAHNATAFSATGSWRARVVDGELYVKMIRVHRHWAERASVLRMMLLALRKSAPPADLDIVYAHADNDPTPPAVNCSRLRPPRRRSRCTPRAQLPLLTNSRNPRSGGLPAPEFTWTGWGHAPPWCQQARTLDAAATAAPWQHRDARLFFSGGLDNGHHRKELRKLALAEQATLASASAASAHLLPAARLLRVRDVGSRFHRWNQYDLQQPSGVATHLARVVRAVPASAACGHQCAPRCSRAHIVTSAELI